jgi:putative endonuclease
MALLSGIFLLVAFGFRHSTFDIRHSEFGIRQRGHSSVGRAPALQAGCQGFESPCLQSSLAAVVKSEDCRAEALAKADRFELARANAASYDSASPVAPRSHGEGKPLMHYVYILQSDADERRFYTGLTDDLRKRLQSHNARRVPHTAKWKAWHLKTYVAFQSRTRASDFEQYLKSASGRAFARKRL